MGREQGGIAMKKFLLAGAALTALLGGSASAADLAVKARPLPPVPVWSWTGFYVGINGGGSIAVNSHTFSNVSLPPFATGPLQFNESLHRALAGGLFGGQIGYNWQFGPNWVIGAEADWQWMNEKDDACVFGCGANFFGLTGTGTFLTDSQKIKSLVTARARLGVTNGGWLWYVTGGGAWAKIDETMVLTGTILPGVPGLSSTIGAAFSNTKGGWTVGGGVETSLWNSGWSAKLEYLYADFGTITNSFATPATFTIFGASVTTSSYHLQDHIIRVGINYRFGGPVMAAY
jgi:outer membrane immunogenic protein